MPQPKLYDPELMLVNGHPATPRMIQIFELLLKNEDKIVRWDSIFNHLYGLDPNGGPLTWKNTVKVFISRLRRRLTDSEYKIIAFYGTGFLLTKNRAVISASKFDAKIIREDPLGRAPIARRDN